MVMNKDVWVFAEQKRGELQKVTLELLAEAVKLANKLGGVPCAVLLGYQVECFAETLAYHGAKKIYLVEHELLSEYSNDAYTKAIVDLMKEYNPRLCLFGATSIGTDFVPRVAAKMKAGMISNCTIFKVSPEGELSYIKPVYGGKIDSTITISSKGVQIATVKSGLIDMDEPDISGKAEIIKVKVRIDPEDIHAKPIGFVEGDPKTVDLTEADIIVSGGRGLEKKENFRLIEELADAIGGSVAGSRVAMDLGWVHRERLVGQTGKTVTPKLYIACGISGDMKHVIGMKDSEFIIAINKDTDAPIFQIADIKIPNDIIEIAPAITGQARKLTDSE